MSFAGRNIRNENKPPVALLQALSHNRRAADAGSDDIWELRATDADAAKCRRRYAIFKVQWHAVGCLSHP